MRKDDSRVPIVLATPQRGNYHHFNEDELYIVDKNYMAG